LLLIEHAKLKKLLALFLLLKAYLNTTLLLSQSKLTARSSSGYYNRAKEQTGCIAKQKGHFLSWFYQLFCYSDQRLLDFQK